MSARRTNDTEDGGAIIAADAGCKAMGIGAFCLFFGVAIIYIMGCCRVKPSLNPLSQEWWPFFAWLAFWYIGVSLWISAVAQAIVDAIATWYSNRKEAAQ